MEIKTYLEHRLSDLNKELAIYEDTYHNKRSSLGLGITVVKRSINELQNILDLIELKENTMEITENSLEVRGFISSSESEIKEFALRSDSNAIVVYNMQTVDVVFSEGGLTSCVPVPNCRNIDDIDTLIRLFLK